MSDVDPKTVGKYGPSITYPDGTVCDRLTGAVLRRPGDDPAKHRTDPVRLQEPVPATPPPAAPPRDSRFPALNFDLSAGHHLLTPKLPREVRYEQDRFLSALSTAAPGFRIRVQHYETNGWHEWGHDCARLGCERWPIWTRSVLPNEVVFECDSVVRGSDGEVDKAASYRINRDHTRRVMSVLDKLTRLSGDRRACYVACLTGSKGVRLTVYLDLPAKTTAREARRMRALLWVHVLRLAGYRVGVTPTGRPDAVTNTDGSIVKWDPACVWWVKRRQIHAWGDLARRTPYTWAGFRLPEEMPRELRMPPRPKRWDATRVAAIRDELLLPDPSAVFEEGGADEVVLPPGAFSESDARWLVDACCRPAEHEHDHALQTLALRLKGLGATLEQAWAFFRDHWTPQGMESCTSPSHALGDALYGRLRNFYESVLVIRPRRWKPPEFVEPTDGSAPILLPGQAKKTGDEVCPFGVRLGKRYRFHRRGGRYHLQPYDPSCNNALCPIHYSRVAHRAAVVATEDMARLFGAPEAPIYRDAAIEEYGPENGGHMTRGRVVGQARKPVDQFAPGEEWRRRPVRMVIGFPDVLRLWNVAEYGRLRKVAEEVARSQGFLIHRTFWHYGPGAGDVKDLCTKGWHLETVGTFAGMPPKADGDRWDDPVSGCVIAYRPITGSVLQSVRSLRITAALVVDTLAEAKSALEPARASGPAGEEGVGGERRVSRVRFRVQAETACHDLCPRPDHHPEPPPEARWCVLCPPADAWVGRREWTRCTYIGKEGPPARPVDLDAPTFQREWRAEELGWFRAPARHRSAFDHALWEEAHRDDLAGGGYS